ncbi:Subtilase family protein [Forsythia ovata]|uniref:Subtilase family protein n=1 Tax=Forsythia ovata TaxID=205694 RepID=A0ABD1PFP9_9LAMI
MQMVYSYRHSFSGFAAKLTESQAKKIAGILPNPAFKDEGLGPIPARWQGECESVDMFDASKQCNNKVIGARFYKDGFEMEFQGNLTDYFTYSDNPSPLDIVGHGSHVASTAAGSFVANATYFGHNFGTFRGGAPRARLAVYKACWYC